MNALAQPLDSAGLGQLLSELGSEAHKRRFNVAPNPCVGAAVMAGGHVVARGFHERWGGDHAEIEALEAAARSGIPRAHWDTLVVTLEPCSTRGKTGPCTKAIMESGIESVVIGAEDPDPRHRGAGIEFLREAGLSVTVVDGASPLETVSPHFLRWNRHERLRRPHPWIVAKWAQTHTGQLTPPENEGDGRTISCKESRDEVMHLRASVDAIVTGVGCVLADDPRLTVRLPARTANAPARVILDSSLRTPPDARLFDPPGSDEFAGPVRLLCVTGPDPVREQALAVAGAGVHGMRGDDRMRLNLRTVQTWLWDMGYRRVLLEAGPTLIDGFFGSEFVDQIRVVTGEVRGGRGESLAHLLNPALLTERLDRECGQDAVLEAFLKT